MTNTAQEYDETWEHHEKFGGRIVPTDDPNTPVLARVEYRVYNLTDGRGGARWRKVFTTFSEWAMRGFLRSGYRAHYSFHGTSNK